MNEETLQVLIDRCSDEFGEFCAMARLVGVGPVDKYGSYVFEAGAHVNGLNRSIALALTPGEDDERVHIEYLVGADDGLHYMNDRRRGANGSGLSPVDLLGEKGTILADLKRIWGEFVEDVTTEDLNATYVVPRDDAAAARVGSAETGYLVVWSPSST